MEDELRFCFREPIPEIAQAAELLSEMAAAHFDGQYDQARDLLLRTNLPVIREWTESLWGKGSPYRKLWTVTNPHLLLRKQERVVERMPTEEEKQKLIERDGCHCRFCGIPVIRVRVRKYLHRIYGEALPWGRTNQTQHAAFQAMWAQSDHLLPRARGGDNKLDNIAITCAPCNFCRMNYTLEEVGLVNPLTRKRIDSPWDGLERVLH